MLFFCDPYVTFRMIAELDARIPQDACIHVADGHVLVALSREAGFMALPISTDSYIEAEIIASRFNALRAVSDSERTRLAKELM